MIMHEEPNGIGNQNYLSATSRGLTPGLDFDPLSRRVIGCALEVHRHLGPGLLETAYEQCLAYELSQKGIAFKTQVGMPVQYKEVAITCGFRLDLLVEDQLIVELKAVDSINSVHEAQILTYLKMTKLKTGLLFNFNVKLFKEGIRRFVK